MDLDPLSDFARALTRRHFFGRAASGIGVAALASLLDDDQRGTVRRAGPQGPHFTPRARRVIHLFQSGAPSQLELFDPKPELLRRHGEELPESVRKGQRLTTMTSGQASFPMAGARVGWAQHGACGAWISDRLPQIARIADRICIVRSMHTDAINHDPAITFALSGHQQPGRPSLGSWISYGLGSENRDLPAFVVMISHGSARRDAQPLFARLWGSGFIPTTHQGVLFRSAGDPVLHLSDPPGIDRQTRRHMLDALARLNARRLATEGDPEIATRISQYEMAFRMQASVPELTDLSTEPASTFALYGEEARKPGTFAANCLLARRLVERGVRFVQLFHRGWDQHFNLPTDLAAQCHDTDRPSAALVLDLERRGLLDDTLVLWGGEFGRTNYCQGQLTPTNYGRDHHPRAFSLWLAGGGTRPGHTHGATDDLGYNIAQDPTSIYDLNATLLHLLGLDHTRLTFRFQGRDFRLTDVHGEVVRAILA